MPLPLAAVGPFQQQGDGLSRPRISVQVTVDGQALDPEPVLAADRFLATKTLHQQRCIQALQLQQTTVMPAATQCLAQRLY